MTHKDKTLLQKAICHWERMRDDPFSPDAPTEDDCALCAAYKAKRHALDTCCALCPVRQSTGVGGCEKTPYLAAYKWWNQNSPSWTSRSWCAWRRRAQKMIDFLESLLG